MIADSPEEMEVLLAQQQAEDTSLRMTAGFCWPWSKPQRDGALIPDNVHVGQWARPWNNPRMPTWRCASRAACGDPATADSARLGACIRALALKRLVWRDPRPIRVAWRPARVRRGNPATRRFAGRTLAALTRSLPATSTKVLLDPAGWSGPFCTRPIPRHGSSLRGFSRQNVRRSDTK